MYKKNILLIAAKNIAAELSGIILVMNWKY
jgi:hypothetical protein